MKPHNLKMELGADYASDTTASFFSVTADIL